LERKGEEAASFAFSSTTDLLERNGLELAVAGPVMNSEEEKDFASKSIVPYIVVGGVFTVLFIVSLVVVANVAIG